MQKTFFRDNNNIHIYICMCCLLFLAVACFCLVFFSLACFSLLLLAFVCFPLPLLAFACQYYKNIILVAEVKHKPEASQKQKRGNETTSQKQANQTPLTERPMKDLQRSLKDRAPTHPDCRRVDPRWPVPVLYRDFQSAP